jgi:hypothetical protein
MQTRAGGDLELARQQPTSRKRTAGRGPRAADLEVIDHTDSFFGNEVAHRLAGDLQSVAWALRDAAAEDVVLDHAHIRRLYRRLIWIFRAELTSFERKQYSSLSHEPNKAMNLNSYIGLMGGSFREIRTVTGVVLAPADPADANVHSRIPTTC